MHTTTLIIKLVIINKHKDGIGSEIVGKSSDIIVRKTVSANKVVVTYDTRSPDYTGNNEYYSSEDTVKVKIGEKLTWKRVVAFFDRCLFVFFFIISFITTVNGKLFLYYMCICINFLYISFCAYILEHSSLNLLSLHMLNIHIQAPPRDFLIS
jgi:hypothetical protein